MVLGGSGFLGLGLLDRLGIDGTAVGTYLRGKNRDGLREWLRLDISAKDDVLSAVRSVAPTVIINAAHRQNDWNATATGAANAAIAAESIGAHFVQISSDAVFSGADGPYRESAPPDPITPYGAAKAAAETAVRAILPSATIIRTSLIIGDNGASEHERLTHAAVRGESVLYRDDRRCPIHVSDLAEAIKELALRHEPGIFHIAGPDAISRYELGRLIAERDGLDPDRIKSANRADLRHPGPHDVRIDSTASRSILRTRIRGAREFARSSRLQPPSHCR